MKMSETGNGMTPLPAPTSTDLWLDRNYRRLWLSILVSSFGGQITSLALSLTSAILLEATPSQVGTLGAIGIAPFVLLSIPAGVWLDRVHKLPVYIAGEATMALTLASIPLAWAAGRLDMDFLYGIACVSGCVSVISGTAAQIVLTQIVPRERLVEAHARNGLATSTVEILGPGIAGTLIKLVGAPLALLSNAALLLASILLLSGVRVTTAPRAKASAHFWQDLKDGISYVATNHLLMTLALVVGFWQIFQSAAMVVQVLFAIRTLGLNEYQYGLCFSAAGLGTVVASTISHRLSHRIGPGPCLILGMAISGAGWLQLAWAPIGTWGVIAFVLMLLCFSTGTVLIFSNMLALRQAITPTTLLARMTGTMRFMTVLPAGPGALIGGFLGEHFSLRVAIGFGGMGAIALAALLWKYSALRYVTRIPQPAG